MSIAVQATIQNAINIDSGWALPRDIKTNVAPLTKYPVDCFPDVMRAAVEEYQKFGQQPLSLICNSALACLALSGQGIANICRDHQSYIPLSLSILTIAESGERKSTADKVFSGPIRKWQSDKLDELIPEFNTYETEVNIRDAELDGLYRKVRSGKATAENDQRIKDLSSEEIIRPQRTILFYEDITTEALISTFAKEHPSAALWSDEGGIVFGGYSMSNEKALQFLTILNRLWDGSEVSTIRKTSENAHLKGRRFTVNVATQNGVIDKLMNTGDGVARSVGYLARFLIASPESTQGYRVYKEPPKSSPLLDDFHARISDLLNLPLNTNEKGQLYPPAIYLEPTAKQLWTDYYNDVELRLRNEGDYEDLKDFASKNAENALRIAGLLHIFENGDSSTQVSELNMRRGCALANWYLESAKHFLNKAKQTALQADLENFEGWVIENLDEDGKSNSATFCSASPQLNFEIKFYAIQ